MAFGDVVSSDVVGYDTSTLNSSGNTAIGASFLEVGGVANKMSDIQITGYGTEYTDGMIVASKLTPGGSTAASYTWIDFSDEEAGTFYGWYNEDGSEDYNDVSLAPGEGLWLQGSGFSMQSSGKVPGSSISVTLTSEGNRLVANPMPTTLSMGDVSVTGYGDSYTDGMIVASKLTSGGTTAASYVWIDFSDEEAGTYYGWYNEDGSEDYNNDELSAGEALWVQSPSSDYSICFPSPLAN